jgi:hypothetical protein
LAVFLPAFASSENMRLLPVMTLFLSEKQETYLKGDVSECLWMSDLSNNDEKCFIQSVATLRNGSLIVVCSSSMLSTEKNPSFLKRKCFFNVRGVDEKGNMQWEDNFFADGHISIKGSNGFGDAVAICGVFDGTVTFAKGRPEEKQLRSNGELTSFVACFSSDGRLCYVSSIFGVQDNSPALINSVALNSEGEVALTGSFFGTICFEGEDGLLELKHRHKRERIRLHDASGGASCFTACLSREGKACWAKVGPIAAGTEGDGIAWAKNGELIVIGFYRGNILDAASPIEPEFVEPPNYFVEGDDNCFLAKYSKRGDLLWVQNVAKGSLALRPSVVTMEDGSIIAELLGCNHVTIIGSGQEIHAESWGKSDVVVAARYDSSGRFIWGKNITSPLNMWSFDNYGYVRLTNTEGGFAIAGTFKGTLYAGSGSAIRLLKTLGWGSKRETAFVCEYDANGEIIFANTPFAGRLNNLEMAASETENKFYFGVSAEGDVKLFSDTKWPRKSALHKKTVIFLTAVKKK